MSAPAFTRLPHPNPTADDVRAAALADPVFGRVFTDHMVSIRSTEGKGWHDAQVMPRGPLSLDPATAVLHYAQYIFEGLKAYRLDDRLLELFRVEPTVIGRDLRRVRVCQSVSLHVGTVSCKKQTKQQRQTNLD